MDDCVALLEKLALAHTEADALAAGAHFVLHAAAARREDEDIGPGATCVNLFTSAGGSRSELVGRLVVSCDDGRIDELRASPVFVLCCDAIAARVLFLRMLNGNVLDAVAWACADEGAAFAPPLPRRGSSTKFEDVTVVFIDIVNFTKACSRQEPERVYDWVDGLFKKFDNLCEKYAMYKTKTVGDAYVATSGMKGTRTSNAGHALRFAIEAHAAAAATPACDGALFTTLRVGIHTGAISAGPIGCSRDTFCMLGDTARAPPARSAAAATAPPSAHSATARR